MTKWLRMDRHERWTRRNRITHAARLRRQIKAMDKGLRALKAADLTEEERDALANSGIMVQPEKPQGWFRRFLAYMGVQDD